MNNDKIKDGGKILASGGFGCIFSPALKCKNTKKNGKNMITKLMIKKYAELEYNNIIKLNSILNKIPDYRNYFLINDFSLCSPKKLSKNDLINFKKCKIGDNITRKNINSSLNDLLALNMPYGGIPIDDYIFENKDYEKIMLMNEKMIELLNNGICPMNKMNIYHNDIKDSNILIDYSKPKDIKLRLIDWNLTIHYIPYENNKFPKYWRNRPLQFNIPFSVILFTDMFYVSYSNLLEKLKINEKTQNIKDKLLDNKVELTNFTKNYIIDWIKERGLGHYKYINKIMFMLYNHSIPKSLNLINDHDKKKYIEKNYTHKLIINYLIEILLNFTSFKKEDGSLNMREYLDNVFIKIVDIFGFIISYFPIYQLLYANYKVLDKKQMLILNKLKFIFIEYLYKPRIQEININNLVNDLENINKIIRIKNNSNKNKDLRKNNITRKNIQ